MLIIDLLTPFTMIGFGKYFLKTAPKEINAVFVYRTTMSMKNKDTWLFANKYCGKIWYKAGLIMLPISFVIMLFVIGRTKDMIGMVGGIVCFVQMIPLVGTIIPTERALKMNFDENGNRKRENKPGQLMVHSIFQSDSLL